MGFTVRESGHDSVEVEITEEHDAAAVGAQLQLYVHVWAATRQDVSAAVEPADRGEAQHG